MYRYIQHILLISLSILTSAIAFEPLFDSRLDYPMDGYISSLASADFNNDGYLDIACGSNTYTGELYTDLKIFINNGDGTFGTPFQVYSGINTTAILTGDFNGDGYKDILTMTDYYNDLNVIMNLGDGTFKWKERLYSFGSAGISVLDFNNDGYDDIVSIPGDGFFYVYFCKGDSSFAALEEAYIFPFDAYGSPRPWDVNHDEYTDLLLSGFKLVSTDSVNSYQQPVVSTYINNGDSTLQEGTEYLHGDSADYWIRSLVPGYFNADSDQDLLLTDALNNRIILINQGDGSFLNEYKFVKEWYIPVVCGDFNHDNLSDFVFTNTQDLPLAVKLNTSKDIISFSDSVGYPGKYTDNPTYQIKLYSADLNNDNNDEIIQYDWTLSTIFSHGDGTFPEYTLIENMSTKPANITKAFDIMARDFNNDGKADIMTIGDGGVKVSYNDGLGNFSEAEKINTYIDWLNGFFSGDFNADNILDFAVIAGGTNNGLKLFHGLEEGGFDVGPNLTDTLGFFTGYGGLSADFNNDDQIDFATFYSGNYDLNVLLSDTDSSFSLASYNLPNTPNTTHQAMATADIDQDDDLDIVIGSANPGIYVNINNGSGAFPTYTVITTEHQVMGVVLEDLNNDGYADIAASQLGAYTGFVSVFINNTDGSFSSPVNYSELYAPGMSKLKASDMDNDGDTDLIAAVESYNSIAILFNGGDGTFSEVQYYAGGDNPNNFALADFDQDSTMDIAVLSSVPDRELVYVFPQKEMINTDLADQSRFVKLPTTSDLLRNYPNPFNPETVIPYKLTVSSDVKLDIYNILGQKVASLVNYKQKAGSYRVKWNARGFASGIYFYQLRTDNFVKTRRMLLLK